MKLVLFDWDGTLVDTHYSIAKVHVESLAAADLAVSEAEVLDLFGQTAKDLIPSVRKLRGLPTLAADDPVLLDQLKIFGEVEIALLAELYRTGGIRLIPGARGLLEELVAQDTVIGVASNGLTTDVNRWVDLLGMRDLFGTRIYGPDRVHYRGKPDPAMLNLAMQDSGINAANTIMVGDTVNDMGAGKSAGVRSILIAHHGAEPTERALILADHTVDGFEALRAALAS